MKIGGSLTTQEISDYDYFCCGSANLATFQGYNIDKFIYYTNLDAIEFNNYKSSYSKLSGCFSDNPIITFYDNIISDLSLLNPKNGFISIEHLYHLGSPWLTSNTNLDGTVHTIFDQSFDPIGLLSFVRFFHIPFTSLDRTLSSSDKSNQIFQEIGAAPLIFLDSSGHNGLSHALANYMLAIHIWHSNLEEAAVLLKSDSIVPESIGTYPFKEFVDPGIRSSFAIYFNIEQYPKGYRGFNLQRGIRNCGSSVRKSDCRSLVYANHELAKHSFSDATWYGSKLHNAFSTLHEATSCIDKLIDIEKTPISSQLSVSVFSACSKKETTGRESMVFEQAML